MPITLKSTGGGSVSIDVPSTGSTFTLTAPANNATIFTTDGGAITGNVAFTSNNVSIGGQTISPAVGMRNRIINGDMRIDQRFAGAANTISSAYSFGYSVDRWATGLSGITGTYTVQQMNGANTSASNYEAGSAPAGFINSLKCTVGTANTSTPTNGVVQIYQPIEGLNTSDLDWGKSTAKTVTVSFWCKSNITGQFSALVYNNAANRPNPQSFTINSANTWEYKTITFTGDTTGTWLTNNSTGVYFQIYLALGSDYQTSTPGWNSSAKYGITGQTNWMATSGNTFYITGVQFEVGSVATPFEFRQYGTELNLCMRYYINYSYGATVSNTIGISGNVSLNSQYFTAVQYPVRMRASPTIVYDNWANSGFGTTMLFQVVGPCGFNAYSTCNSTTVSGYILGGYIANAEL